MLQDAQRPIPVSLLLSGLLLGWLSSVGHSQTLDEDLAISNYAPVVSASKVQLGVAKIAAQAESETDSDNKTQLAQMVNAPGDDGLPMTMLSGEDGLELLECDPCNDNSFFAEQSQYPTAKLTGFFQADALWYQQDNSLNQNQFFNSDLQDVRGFRRARLGAVGSVSDNVDYMVEFDFAFPGRPTFMDLYMDVKGFSFGNVRVGHWRQPFGMAELTSVKELTFLERPSTALISPFRKPGIGIYGSDGRSTYALSAFGTTLQQRPDQTGLSSGDSQYGFAGRLTTLLMDRPQDQSLIHVGAGYSQLNGGSLDNGLAVFFIPPEIAGPDLSSAFNSSFNLGEVISVGATKQTHLFNTELAAVRGPMHAQGEYRVAMFERINPFDISHPSFYAQIGYLLTGESRQYNRAGGVLSTVRPNRPFGPGGWGAWELAARFSQVETSFRNNQNNRISSYLVGLNWYLNEYAKFQFNYLRVDRDYALGSNSNGDDNYGIYAIRAQVAF